MEILINGNVTVTVHTASGSLYTFRKKGDNIAFLRGMMEGVVTKFKQPISLGGVLAINFRKYGIYGQLENSEMFLRSTRITRIEISE